MRASAGPFNLDVPHTIYVSLSGAVVGGHVADAIKVLVHRSTWPPIQCVNILFRTMPTTLHGTDDEGRPPAVVTYTVTTTELPASR